MKKVKETENISKRKETYLIASLAIMIILNIISIIMIANQNRSIVEERKTTIYQGKVEANINVNQEKIKGNNFFFKKEKVNICSLLEEIINYNNGKCISKKEFQEKYLLDPLTYHIIEYNGTIFVTRLIWGKE